MQPRFAYHFGYLAFSGKLRGMNKLTDRRVRTIKPGRKPQRYGDGFGLMLLVQPGGTKSWVQRLTINKMRTDLGLGRYPIVTLAAARNKAIDNLRAVDAGDDPRKRQTAIPTFGQAAEAVHKANAARWSAGVASEFLSSLHRHAGRLMGRPVDAIGQVDVIATLAPVMSSTPRMGRKLRGNVRAVFAWATANQHRGDNPADGRIDAALPRQTAQTAHHAAVAVADVSDTLRRVEAAQGPNLAALALMRFVVLTACRTGEARLAKWNEIDWESRTWTIPAGRTKTRRDHRVPLADEAIEVLREVMPLRESGDYIFPSATRAGRPMNQNVLLLALRKAGVKATVHGFRSSFRDWAAEQGAAREVAEAALAHVTGGVEGAYCRTDYLERRRPLMAAWAAFVIKGKTRALRVA